MPDETNSTNTNNRKLWWAPVWSGLVMDQDGKHYKIIRNTLWLYLYFLLNADRRSGTLARKIRTISSDMEVSRTTVIRD